MLLALEQSVNPNDRLKYQKLYTHLLNNGERALVVRWKQSVSANIMLFKISNKFFFLQISTKRNQKEPIYLPVETCFAREYVILAILILKE